MRQRYDTEAAIGFVDPLDGGFVAAAWTDSRAGQTLLEEIVAGPVDRPGRVDAHVKRRSRVRVLRLVVGVAVAAVAFVLAQGFLTDATPAFAVRQLTNGVVQVDAATQFRDGNALATELRAYGINVKVTAVPSSPSEVGKVGVFAPGGGDYIPKGLTFGPDGSDDVFHFTIDPRLFTERLTIEMHVAARPGERYVIAQEVFEPGEALGGLECALGEPLKAEELVPYLTKLQLSPQWFVISPTDDPTIYRTTQVDKVPDGEVMSGYSVDATTVHFEVKPDGVTLPPGGYGLPHLSDVPCTPDQAAAWR